MKNAETKMIAVILFWLILAVDISVMAQYNVGVIIGDWIQYNLNVSAGGVPSSGTIKVRIFDVRNVHIIGIVEYKTNYPGFPNRNQSFEIYTPTWNGTDGFLIPSGLAKGQIIPGLYPTTTIQDVVDWRWRKAVKATAFIRGLFGEAYWDQETGALLEIRFSTPGVTGGIKATGTNMFSIDGYDWLLRAIIILIVIVIVILAVELIMSRRERALYRGKPPTTSVPSEAARASRRTGVQIPPGLLFEM